MNAPLLLASTSPRRRELLTKAGIAFEVAPVDVDEIDASSAPHLAPTQMAEANAELKARAARQPGRWVLGADTVVAVGPRLLGKPASMAEAREFLQVLSGRAHEVITGCALLGPAGEAEIFHEISRVRFRTLDEATIESYLARVHVLDKAGGYALQEHGEMLIEQVEGSRSNVIGLPIKVVRTRLRAHGIVGEAG